MAASKLLILLAIVAVPAAARRQFDAAHRKQASEQVTLGSAAAKRAPAELRGTGMAEAPVKPQAAPAVPEKTMASLLYISAKKSNAAARSSGQQLGNKELTMADYVRKGAGWDIPPKRQVQKFPSFSALLGRQEPQDPMKLPEQGFKGKDVGHANMQTATADWTSEYGHKAKGSGKDGAEGGEGGGAGGAGGAGGSGSGAGGAGGAGGEGGAGGAPGMDGSGNSYRSGGGGGSGARGQSGSLEGEEAVPGTSHGGAHGAGKSAGGRVAPCAAVLLLTAAFMASK